MGTKRSEGKTKPVVWKGSEHRASDLAAEWRPKLEKAFRKYQSRRERHSVYGYLTAVYRFRRRFSLARDAAAVGALMIAEKGLSASRIADPFNSVIRATATVDERVRWKWVRCLTLAFLKDIEARDLQLFIMHYGGINKCAHCFDSDS